MRALNRQGRGEVLTEKGRRKEGWQTTMERDGMTDRAIKEEREVSQRSTNLLRCSTPYVYYPCIYTLAMLLTQRYYLRMYVRTYVSTYLRI